MKKIVCLLSFFVLCACDTQMYVFIPDENESELENIPETINPPVIQVDSSLVIISDTIKVSF